MNFKSREKLLASGAALSLLGISPQQTFAAQITTNQAVQQTKKITGNVSDAMAVSYTHLHHDALHRTRHRCSHPHEL